MLTKWFDVAFRCQKQDAPNGKSTNTPVPSNHTSAEAAPADKVCANAGGKGLAKSQGDLQSIEEIYRVARITNPRMGYSIYKLVEMLNSDHIRELSDDAKRGAVLMALDAAGISIDEVLHDATLRQHALDSYEANQRKHFEECWARKIEGNVQTQKEMERVTAQCLDLIKRTQDEVELEKKAFARWQTMKRQEAERISKAVGLYLKPSPPEPPSVSLLGLRGKVSTAKPSQVNRRSRGSVPNHTIIKNGGDHRVGFGLYLKPTQIVEPRARHDFGVGEFIVWSLRDVIESPIKLLQTDMRRCCLRLLD